MPWLKKASTTATANIPLAEQWNSTVGSSVTAYRSGNVVSVVAWRLSVLSGTTGEVAAYSLPLGYRPPPLFTAYTSDSRGAAVRVGTSNTVTVTNPSVSVSNHSITFVTTDPMPTGGM